jgi:hypothetical protein
LLFEETLLNKTVVFAIHLDLQNFGAGGAIVLMVQGVSEELFRCPIQVD